MSFKEPSSSIAVIRRDWHSVDLLYAEREKVRFLNSMLEKLNGQPPSCIVYCNLDLKKVSARARGFASYYIESKIILRCMCEIANVMHGAAADRYLDAAGLVGGDGVAVWRIDNSKCRVNNLF